MKRRLVPWLGAGWAAVAFWVQWRSTLAAWPLTWMAFQGPMDWTWMSWAAHWADILAGMGCLSLYWLAARGGGLLLSGWFGRPWRLTARESLPLIHIVGFGLYGSLVVAFGLLGLFFSAVASGRLTAMAVLGVWLTRRQRRPRPHAPIPRDLLVLTLATALVAVFLATFSLTPETWIDSLAYHLTAPQDFNKLHKWVDFHQDMYRYPLLPEGIYSQGMLIGGERLALLLNLTGTALTCWLLWVWADRLAGPVAGWLACLSLLASDQVGFHIGQANEGMHAVAFATLGVWAWIRALESPRPARWSVLVGVGLGWALCAKYTAAAPGIGIFGWHLVKCGRRPARELAMLGWMALGCGLAVAPFLVNGWLFTRNPVYPLYFGGLHWSEENTRLLTLFGCVGYDFSLGDPPSIARSAFRLMTEEQPLFLLSLPLIAVMRGRWLTPFVVAWLGALAAWSVGVPCLRLMMPMFPAMSLVAAVAMAPAWTSPAPRRRLTRMATAAILALGLIETIGATDSNHRGFNAAMGLEASEHYLGRILTTYDEATRVVNRTVPVHERLLVIGDARGYRFRPLAYNRDIEDTPVVLDLARGARDSHGIRVAFRQMGVRWVLLNFVTSEYLSAFTNQVFQWRPLELQRSREFWALWTSIVWHSPRADGNNGGFVLYRIGAQPGPGQAILPYLPGAEGVGIRGPGESPQAHLARLAMVDRMAPGITFLDARAASSALAAGQPGEALRLASRGLHSGYVESHVLHGERGLALGQLHRWREAARAFAAAEALHPEETRYHVLRLSAERYARGPSDR